MLRLDDPAFALPEHPPWDSDSSVFRSRGSALQHHALYAREKLPGGLPSLKRALGSARLVEFLDTDFKANEWYDIAPAAYFSRAAAQVRGVPFVLQVREFNAWTLRSKITAFYRALLPAATPSLVALALPHGLTMVQNFGAVHARAEGSRVIAVRSGVPQPLVFWYAHAVEGFIAGFFDLVGRKNVRVAFQGAEPEGTSAGQRVYRLHFEIVWP